MDFENHRLFLAHSIQIGATARARIHNGGKVLGYVIRIAGVVHPLRPAGSLSLQISVRSIYVSKQGERGLWCLWDRAVAPIALSPSCDSQPRQQ